MTKVLVQLCDSYNLVRAHKKGVDICTTTINNEYQPSDHVTHAHV